MIAEFSSLQRCIAIVGMNGVGKSNFGKSLASKLHRTCIDIDKEFTKAHGDIHAFIATYGWEAFRLAEQEIIPARLKPQYVTVLGGGAIESVEVRRMLKEHALVLWMQGGHKQVRRNLTRAKVARPEFKEKNLSSAVKELLQARTPFYAEVADIVLPPNVRYSQQVSTVLRLLGVADRKMPAGQRDSGQRIV